MRAPALAIGWEFRQRHRWGLIAVAGYLVVAAAVKLLMLRSGQPVHVDDAESFAAVVMVPLTSTVVYFLAVFSFGLSGDLTARQSMYPARMFTLPVTTDALAGWPMLYGSAAMTILWVATRLFAPWPSGVAVPVVWPALAAAALLAWTQALTWMPYGLPGLRLTVCVLWLAAIDSVVLVAVQYQAPESLMVAFLAPQLPLAYLAARYAVARARRGDIPDWRHRFARLGRMAKVVPSRRDHFASPARAQLWFEWRRHGRSLPAWVGILLPFELSLLFLAVDTPMLVFLILLGVLLTPPFMASFTAGTISRATPFTATRPVTSDALVAAKLKMTVWSTLAAWLLVLIALPLALQWSGTWSVVIERAQRLNGAIGTPRAVVFALLVLAGFIVSTWKQLVQSLFIGLSGREWLIKGSVVVALTFLVLLGPVVQWIIDTPGVAPALWDALPLILAGLVGLKMSAAAWIAARLARSRLLSDRALVAGAACWCVAVLALYAMLVWFFSTPFVARYVLALIAILAVPLARLSVAPLAFAWNRHR